MVDFLRLVEGPLVGVVIFLVVVFGLVTYVRRHLDAQEKIAATRVRNILTAIAIAGFLIYAINAASVNSVPRGQLDRGVVNDRANDLDKRVHQSPQPETPKQERDKR